MITQVSALTPPYDGPQTMSQPSGETFKCYMQESNGQSFWTYEDTDYVIKQNENGYWYFVKFFDEPQCSSAKCKIDQPLIGTMTKANMISWLQNHPDPHISFKVSGQIGESIYDIGNHIITFNMYRGASINALTPEMSWGYPGHNGIATPGNGVAQNFSNPVTYTVNYYDAANNFVDAETWKVECKQYYVGTQVNVWNRQFLDDDGNAVFDLIPNENIHLDLETSIDGTILCSAIFAAVLYDSQKHVKDIKIVPYLQGTTECIDPTFLLPDDTRGYCIKVFCFDTVNGLKPLMTPITFPEQRSNNVEVVPRVVVGSDEWELKMSIVNYSDQQVHINHPSSQDYDFALLGSGRNELYRWSSGKDFVAAVTTTTINPGKKIEYSQRLNTEQYYAMLYQFWYMRAYIAGSSNDFTIDPNGYETMVNLPRPLKPNIYLYPKKEQKISVQLNPEGYITKSIPYYGDGWNFNVTPEGKIDEKYDYLFYEGVLKSSFTLDKGWVLDQANFESGMDDILTRLGLNEKEKQDFLEYWTKALDWTKPYYAVYYISSEEIDKAIPLTISPKPDSIMRMFFYFVPVDGKIKLKEPSIQTFERNGFSAVEWGGMKK